MVGARDSAVENTRKLISVIGAENCLVGETDVVPFSGSMAHFVKVRLRAGSLSAQLSAYLTLNQTTLSDNSF